MKHFIMLLLCLSFVTAHSFNLPTFVDAKTPNISYKQSFSKEKIVNLSMEKITLDYLEQNFAIGSDGNYHDQKVKVVQLNDYTNFQVFYKETSLNDLKICETEYIEVLDAILFKINYQINEYDPFKEPYHKIHFENGSTIRLVSTNQEDSGRGVTPINFSNIIEGV